MSESPIGRIPVEIWQRILVFSVSVYVGPIYPLPEDGFMENILVFQDDCSISSAYYAAESTSRRLRLVCRSWNAFLSSLPNEFVAIPCNWHDPDMWPTDERIRTAKRIHSVGWFQCLCTKPCRYSRRWNAKVHYEEGTLLSPGVFQKLVARHGKATTRVLQGTIDFSKFANDATKLADSLPDLRALSTSFYNSLYFPIQEAFPQLTHLELTYFDPRDFPVGLTLSGLTTLSISVCERTGPRRPLPAWNFPELLYLRVEGGFSQTFVDSYLRTLLQATGHGLRGVAIKQNVVPVVSPNGFSFPAEIWSWCPNLTSIGGAVQSLQRTPSPPLSISIDSVIILGLFGNSRSESQVRETSHLVSKFSMWNVDHFRLKWTWEVWLLSLCHRPLARRAEWANFLVQFGLYGRRHGPSLRDAGGVAFDDPRAALVRQAVQVEVVMLSERLETTSWTKFAFQH